MNINEIQFPQGPLVDPKTDTLTLEWFMFLQSVYRSIGFLMRQSQVQAGFASVMMGDDSAGDAESSLIGMIPGPRGNSGEKGLFIPGSDGQDADINIIMPPPGGNLVGPITSNNNVTAITSRTGTGTTFAMQDVPSFSTTIGVGAATPSASGSGVSFPSTQSASTDVNTLDDYEEYTAASAACTGAVTATVVWKLTKIGNSVILTLPATLSAGVATSSFAYGTVIPARFRPSGNTSFAVRMQDNGADLTSPGLIIVGSNGVITGYKNLAGSANFTVTANAGLSADTGLGWTI